MQSCQKVFCFGDVRAVQGNDWETVVEDAVSVTEEKVAKKGAKDGLEEGGDDKLSELYFQLARNV